TVIQERPRRVLARGAAAEVSTRDENRRPLVRGLIKLELRIRRAIRLIAPVKKQELAEAGPLDALEELLRNDLIGVDVEPVERRWDSFQENKRFHLLLISDIPVSNVDEVTGNRRRGSHYWTYQVGSPAFALPPLEVPIRGRSATLAGTQDIRV